MKRIVVLALVVASMVMQTWAQVTDPVIMTIAGKKITRSEFEYSLNKNADSPASVTDQEIKDYVDLFINYRLKVQAALDAKLDTLSSFQKEYRTYRDVQLKPFVYDSVYADSVAHAVYDALKESTEGQDIIQASHILLSVPQNSNKSLLDRQKVRIDSLYNLLVAGADFADLARQYSDDRGSKADGGLLPWVSQAQLLPEFRDAAYELQPGQMSKPVLTPVGYHIIYMNGRKQLEPYEEKRAEILEVLNTRGLQEDAAEHEIEKMVAESGGKLSREDVLLQIQAKAEAADPNLVYLIGEYYDGLLLYEASSRMVWKEAAADEEGLETYFNANKSKYKWTTPKMRGYVYRARSKAMVKKIAKILKPCRGDEGLAKLKEQLPADSLKFVKVHFGVYKQGDDPIVDYLKFKTGEEPKVNKVLPYYGVTGKIQKQPSSYLDAKAQVVADYQDQMEKDWVKNLRKKYSYYVDESVLKTVNKH